MGAAPAWLPDELLRAWVSSPAALVGFRWMAQRREELRRTGLTRTRGRLRRGSPVAGRLAALCRRPDAVWWSVALDGVARDLDPQAQPAQRALAHALQRGETDEERLAELAAAALAEVADDAPEAAEELDVALRRELEAFGRPPAPAPSAFSDPPDATDVDGPPAGRAAAVAPVPSPLAAPAPAAVPSVDVPPGRGAAAAGSPAATSADRHSRLLLLLAGLVAVALVAASLVALLVRHGHRGTSTAAHAPAFAAPPRVAAARSPARALPLAALPARTCSLRAPRGWPVVWVDLFRGSSWHAEVRSPTSGDVRIACDAAVRPPAGGARALAESARAGESDIVRQAPLRPMRIGGRSAVAWSYEERAANGSLAWVQRVFFADGGSVSLEGPQARLRALRATFAAVLRSYGGVHPGRG